MSLINYYTQVGTRQSWRNHSIPLHFLWLLDEENIFNSILILLVKPFSLAYHFYLLRRPLFDCKRTGCRLLLKFRISSLSKTMQFDIQVIVMSGGASQQVLTGILETFSKNGNIVYIFLVVIFSL